ncbi:MAG: type II toxin-antitoxin system Phd/YefM family antitoxin [Erysipelotrichaceae bacterium]|nr:type II toxin-antitoxin system Phd/YefM family antitoxin [Erysipelotrichaceae bacterium]
MDKIRPVSDLRNHFAEISRQVHETKEPVFLTKNGYGDMVVLSMEAYEELRLDSEVYQKLLEAEEGYRLQGKTYSSKEVLKELKESLKNV